MKYWNILFALLAATTLIMTTGCNTTRGIGQDMEAVGETIQDEVDERD
ncbi:MAG: entericidin A/B family lipoprotein [Gammaproteobacteria bacterium]|nr:entericidin A/B family lipoprotein [Gammaproteobacteria bacterium]